MAGNKQIMIDAEGVVLGRLASAVAKKLLEGESVTVAGIDKAIITGEPNMICRKYREKRERGDRIKGPFYPRQPDRLFQRVVRGMLPHRQKKGMDALRRLKIAAGKDGTEKCAKISKTVSEIHSKYITVGELCERLGAKPRWKDV